MPMKESSNFAFANGLVMFLGSQEDAAKSGLTLIYLHGSLGLMDFNPRQICSMSRSSSITAITFSSTFVCSSKESCQGL